MKKVCTNTTLKQIRIKISILNNPVEYKTILKLLMFKYIYILPFSILFPYCSGKKIKTVYFEFATLKPKKQEQAIWEHPQSDTSSIESVQIYGYCDDH
jgi:hypothetical protein